jgi:hypothetical protein
MMYARIVIDQSTTVEPAGRTKKKMLLLLLYNTSCLHITHSARLGAHCETETVLEVLFGTFDSYHTMIRGTN